MRLKFQFEVSDPLIFRQPVLNLTLANSTRAIGLNGEFDSGQFGPYLYVTESFFTIFAGASGHSEQFDSVGFLLNSLENSSLNLDSSKCEIEYHRLPQFQFVSLLYAITIPTFSAKIHPISFPVEYLGKQHIYHPQSLVDYFAEVMEPQSSKLEFYLELNDFGAEYKSCDSGCEQCLSRFVCKICKNGFFLEKQKCVKCSDQCQKCQNHSQSCLLCADGSMPKSS